MTRQIQIQELLKMVVEKERKFIKKMEVLGQEIQQGIKEKEMQMVNRKAMRKKKKEVGKDILILKIKLNQRKEQLEKMERY